MHSDNSLTNQLYFFLKFQLVHQRLMHQIKAIFYNKISLIKISYKNPYKHFDDLDFDIYKL